MSATAQFVQITLDSETIGGAWKLYHYEPGTTNLKNVWVDRAKGTPAAQPLVADANGTVSFYGDGLYDLVVYNSADVLKYTWEDVYIVEVPSLGTEGSTLASAGTVTLGSASEIYNHISGAVTITALSGSQAFVILTFDSTPTLTDGASFQLRNRTSRQARADETVMFVNDGAGVWREVSPVIRLANTQWLTGRNAAGAAEINLIRASAGNGVEISASGVTITLKAATDVEGNLSTTGSFTVTGGQIVFPATQVPSAGVNTLDDYEEGTWTPSVGGSATYTTQLGYYTKIGRMVQVTCLLTINAIGTGSANTISGLPFTAATAAFGPIYWASGAVSPVSLVALVTSGGTTVTTYGATGAAASATAQSVMGNGTTINFTLTYHV